MATGLGATMSPSPQGQLAAYTVQGNNEHLTTKSNWATTFDDHEGAKAPRVKLIMPIMIPHHCNKASYCLQ
jgi:hypothetical protein